MQGSEGFPDGCRCAVTSLDDTDDSTLENVRPVYDRLREYGEATGVATRSWTLLTGQADEIRRLVVEGFRTPLGQPETSGGLMDIAHTGKLVLVDARGAIRGYYDSDATGLDEIFHRSRHVLPESRHER